MVVIGEEVGVYGGAYGVTKDLIETGSVPQRLIDTPISEPGHRRCGGGGRDDSACGRWPS